MARAPDSVLDLAPLREAADASAALGLTSDDLARALGVDPRTVDRWLTGMTYPQREARRKLVALGRVCRHLLDTFTSEDAARGWLNSPQRFLGWLTPAEALRAGRFDRVEGALEALDSGIFI